MIRATLLPHQIAIITPVRVDDGYGNEVLSYDTAEGATTREVRAYVRPAPASEDVVDRNAVTAAWQVHTNDLTVTALERVVYDGLTYDIDGQPNTWRVIPGGRPGHSKFLLRRVDG
ncbi:phage head completion protein [Micromonospora rubida]